jgi:hypothetical protein
MPATKLKGLHRAAGTEIPLGHRAVAMLRPICKVCAPNTLIAPLAWWDDCPHQPYIGDRAENIVTTTYEDDGEGGRVVGETTTKTVLRPWPNLVKVPLSRRISSGLGPDYKRAFNGFIFPEELRCDAYLEGIAPMCEFRECYHQDGLKEYSTGTFCQEQEAVIAYEDARGIPQEVYNTDVRDEQYAQSRAKALA